MSVGANGDFSRGVPAEALLTGVLHGAVLCHSSPGGAWRCRAHSLAKMTFGTEHLARAAQAPQICSSQACSSQAAHPRP